MTKQQTYDVAIVGGGLAGLSASIQLARRGYAVIVLEKETYPFHKVCGEYVSMESWNYLESLGLPLHQMNLPLIDTLFLSAPNGRSLTTKLPLGGFGISRFKLDEMLAQLARAAGVTIRERCTVTAIEQDDNFSIHYNGGTVNALVCCAAYGKRSALDVKWNRSFLQKQDRRLENFIAVKYHVRAEWPKQVIGLHNFENGYCGVSKIEDDRYCLCYLTRASNLKTSANDIQQMEERYLFANPQLKNIFSQSHKLAGFPITIAQVNFSNKTAVEHGVLMLGDAAGMIAPLCGNGMSIALHTGKIAATAIDLFLRKQINRKQMEVLYETEWRKHFQRRLQVGRVMQRFFGGKALSNFFVSVFRALPFLARPVIRQTHGAPF